MLADMFAYYAQNHTASELGDLTLEMIGPRRVPKLNAKGAESEGLVGFALSLVTTHCVQIENGAYLREALGALDKYMKILTSSGRVLLPAARSDTLYDIFINNHFRTK